MTKYLAAIAFLLLCVTQTAAQQLRLPPDKLSHLEVDLSGRRDFERAIGRIREGESGPELEAAVLKFIDSPSTNIRRHALKACSKLKDPSPKVTEAYLYLLEDPVDYLRVAALEEIGKMGAQAVPLIPQIHNFFRYEMTRDPGFRPNQSIIEVLFQIDPTMQHWKAIVAECALPENRGAFFDLDDDIRRQLLRDPEVWRHIENLLKDESPEVRVAGLMLAQRRETEVSSLYPQLVKLLDDDSIEVRRHVPMALVSVDLLDEPTLEKIHSWMQSDDIYLRVAATAAYWRVTKKPEEVAPIIAESLPALVKNILGHRPNQDSRRCLTLALTTMTELGDAANSSALILKRYQHDLDKEDLGYELSNAYRAFKDTRRRPSRGLLDWDP